MPNRLLELKRLFSSGAFLLAGLAVLLSSCQGDYSGPTASLNVGITTNEVNLLILVAEEQGYFTNNGLDIVEKMYPSGVAGLGGLLDHEVELVTGSEFALVGQVLSGKDICTIAAINRSAIEYLVGRVDRGISNVVDLEGKTVGVPLGSRPEFALHRFLYFQGVDVSELTLVDVPVAQSVDALVSGEVDAVAAWEPYTGEAKQRLGGQVVSWSVQEDQPSYNLVMSRADWTRENQELITRFLRSLVQAEAYVAVNPEAARALMREKYSYDEGHMANVWPEHSFSVLLDQALVVAMEDQARWILSQDLAGERQMPDFMTNICEEALEAVKPEAVSLIR